MSATRELLRRLAAHDEACLQAVLAAQPSRDRRFLEPPALDRGIRALVELAALIAADASTPSLRWAVDRAAATGADDHTFVQVLSAAAGAAGSAQTVKSASRLALALDVDTDPERALAQKPGVERARDRLGTRCRPELAVDRMRLGLHRVGRHVELGGDLPERAMAGQEAQDPELRDGQ